MEPARAALNIGGPSLLEVWSVTASLEISLYVGSPFCHLTLEWFPPSPSLSFHHWERNIGQWG